MCALSVKKLRVPPKMVLNKCYAQTPHMHAYGIALNIIQLLFLCQQCKFNELLFLKKMK